MKNLKNSELKRAILKKKLAEAIGFSEDYISKIERNERPITYYILEKLNNLKEGKSKMSNNTPDYDDNLAFEPAKTAGTMETIARDGKAVAIRCHIDNQHYFDLALTDAPNKMDWFDAKIWCEEHYCRLPMKHELKFIGKNLKAINKMLKSVGGKMLNGYYWSSSEGDYGWAWYSGLNLSYGLLGNGKGYTAYVRPVLAL